MSATTTHVKLPRHTDRRDLLLAGLIAVGLLGLFVVVQRVKVPTYDSKIALATARAIAAGRLHLQPADDFYKRNVPYSHYGIGMPLVILPLYLLQRALHAHPNLLTTLANPLLLAACGALLVLCGRELGWSRRLSLAAGLVFGALTMALQASQDLLSEPGVAFSTAMLILGMLRWRAGRRSGSWLAGLGVGISLLFRFDSALQVGVGLLLLPAFVPWRRLLRERWAWVGLALPILAAVLWTGWYSTLRDGTLIPRVYGGTFTRPMLTGLYGLLLSHGKSLFVYNPFLLLAIPGAVALWRRDRAATALLAVLAVARPLLYSRWTAWYGGVAWGPRFLMPVAVPLSLLAVYAVSRIFRLRLVLRVPAALVVVALVIGGGVVSVASVWIWEGASWNWMKHTPSGLTVSALREFRAERSAGYFYSFRNNSIAYNLRRMTQPNRSSQLYHFRGGADPVGLVALVVAGLAPLAAWALARRQRDPPTDGRSPPDQSDQVSTPSLRHQPDTGGGAVASAVSEPEQADCHHENPPLRSRCHPTIRVRRLLLPT